jgi:hypothetical protein
MLSRIASHSAGVSASSKAHVPRFRIEWAAEAA